MTDRTPTQTSHLAQLRKANVECVEKADKAEIDRLLAKTEHFVFTALPAADDEIRASAKAMEEADVWHLPYPVCTFEFDAGLTLAKQTVFQGDLFRFIVLCVEKNGTPHIEHTLIRSTKNGHRWIACKFYRGDEEGVPLIAGHAGDPTMVEVDVNAGVHHGDIVDTISVCLVTLATRGIRRERWIGDKKVLVGRKEPRDAYTRVMIAETIEAGQGTHETAPGERHKVRLHLRRGHIRNQPHGPGRRFTRRIWIEPMLIGYAEEGTIHHDHYEAYASKEIE